MKVSVIGTGNMGSAFARQLVAAGHEVGLVGRSSDNVAAVASETGASAVPAAKAVDADIIILATGFGDAVTALNSLGDLAGKTVVDITRNNFV